MMTAAACYRNAVAAIAFVAACAAISAAAEETSPARSVETVLADLAAGGSVLLMRHANSPDGQIAAVGMTEGCTLQPGRGLDAMGFFQARFIGEFLKSHDVPISAAFTSDMCRAWDTARLVAAGAPVDPAGALKTTNISEIDFFKAALASHFAASPTSNILLVSHSNIVPLYADWTSAEEIPSGVLLVVDPKTWRIRDRLSFGLDVSVDAGGGGD